MEKKPEIHMPAPSFWPIVLAAGMALMAVGLVSSILVSIVGLVILLVAVAGWTMENRAAGQEHGDE
jgi:uncharacterized membrane protein